MNAAPTDRQDFKTGMRAAWDAAAPGWNAHGAALRAWLARPTDAMIGMAGVVPGARVLDIAAGAGEQTLTLAERVGPTGSVLATDLSPEILALARDNAARAGFDHVRTRVADGEDLGVDEGGFDAAVCRLGLMFFPDPLRGLREIHRALRPGGRLCAVVFAAPEKNPCITILMSTALKHAGRSAADPCAPGGLLSLGRPGRLDALFEGAGFREVATTSMNAVFHLPSVDDYLAFVRTSASPIQQILGPLDAAATEAAWADMRQQLRAFDGPAGWAGPNELLLTAGRRP